MRNSKVAQFALLSLVFFPNIGSGESMLVDGKTLAAVTISDVAKQIPSGSIVIVSELHGFAPHHQNQISLIEELAAKGPGLSVGLEFLPFTKQEATDQFLAGLMPEPEFLKTVEWGSPSFDFYRAQATAPRRTNGHLVALNAPRALTRKVSQGGLEALSPEDQELLPEDFTLGNANYRARFNEIMGGHVTEEQLQNYFAAQSIWDEVMARTACEFQRAHPDQSLVVIVGDFHAIYGGGLPDRMRVRGCEQVFVISQVDEPSSAMPDPRWGARGDWVWISENKEKRDMLGIPRLLFDFLSRI